MGFEQFASSRVQDFLILDELFRSSAGSIAKARFRYDNRLYVLKEVAVTQQLPHPHSHSLTPDDGVSEWRSEGKSRKSAMNEVMLLQQLNHPNVIRFHGHFWDNAKRVSGAVSGAQSLYIVLEYCECGDLSRLIAARRVSNAPLEEAFIWRTFYQICLGVQHLHQNGMCV
jgi:serine/threonine protein kinase